ncbi:Uncharacterised protein [Mycobacteroides abscessus subsp. abscessus]|nr:Uncharacterised protein [Mycobacteroides abscessus subsp. abscessus]
MYVHVPSGLRATLPYSGSVSTVTGASESPSTSVLLPSSVTTTSVGVATAGGYTATCTGVAAPCPSETSTVKASRTRSSVVEV